MAFTVKLLTCVKLTFLLEKTVEGTAAGITSVLAACSILLPLLASTGYIFTEVFLLSPSLSMCYTKTTCIVTHIHPCMHFCCKFCSFGLRFTETALVAKLISSSFTEKK